MNINVLRAVFRRNFVSYFANPTGYVFICLFVLLGAIAAFWVQDFFSNNLANLDQLSYWFPFIMLIYIPTITMGIWADERKQGTDELLLTIPAGDFDIVLGKYLAAVAIFTVALLFSLLCNLAVLKWLGDPDVGLFLGTYFGYWLVGLAMLAVGVVGSFLTSNITIGFVLGVLLNMPLVFLVWSDTLFGAFGQQATQTVKAWSISEQFHDFGRGVISLAGLAYFAAIVVVMLYLSMVLIGRRHWFSKERRWVLVGHYVLRSLCLAIIALAAVIVLAGHDLRWDVSQEKLSSLSPKTRELIEGLSNERPVVVDAFVSPTVPEAYVETRLNLLSVLRELRSLGGKHVKVNVYSTESSSSEAAFAQRRYGIEPRRVATRSHGELAESPIFLFVAASCGSGPGSMMAPVFIDRGIPIEYELVRSICTLAEKKRKKLGVLTTDVPLYGGVNMTQGFSMNPNWPVIDELEKQYEVVQVDPSKPITDKFDALLAVQPSSLGPPEMDNFLAMVESGVPTAIFEDPALVSMMSSGALPGTSAPRQPGGMNPMFRMQPSPKGEIRKLWKLLGVDFTASKIVWQKYNPYPKAGYLSDQPEFVFVDAGCGTKQPFSAQDPISSGLQQLILMFPGSVSQADGSKLSFTPLVTTGEQTGYVEYADVLAMTGIFGQRGLKDSRVPTGRTYCLGAHIEGKLALPRSPGEDDQPEGDKKAAGPAAEKKPREAKLNVVLVADVDMLSAVFFRIREQGDSGEGPNFQFDNVPFVLNVLDSLAGEHRFIDIRMRRPKHRTLTRVDEKTQKAAQEIINERDKYRKEREATADREQKEVEDKIAELKQRRDISPDRMLQELGLMQQDMQRRHEVEKEQQRQQHERQIAKSESNLAVQVRQVQAQYKLWAVLLPPIPPLLVAAVVFGVRRAREREGVARSRLR